jgi:hypothetical protein
MSSKEIQRRLDFDQLDGEISLIKRLREHGVLVSTGYATSAERKLRIRAAIIDAGLDCTIAGRNAVGKPENYAELFERHFGEPLFVKRKGKSHV